MRHADQQEHNARLLQGSPEKGSLDAGGDAEIIASDLEDKPAELVVDAGLASHFRAPHVSISLKYYEQKAECWSEWQARDLKGFSKVIEQL
jgi:hypothetical protein